MRGAPQRRLDAGKAPALPRPRQKPAASRAMGGARHRARESGCDQNGEAERYRPRRGRERGRRPSSRGACAAGRARTVDAHLPASNAAISSARRERGKPAVDADVKDTAGVAPDGDRNAAAACRRGPCDGAECHRLSAAGRRVRSAALMTDVGGRGVRFCHDVLAPGCGLKGVTPTPPCERSAETPERLERPRRGRRGAEACGVEKFSHTSPPADRGDAVGSGAAADLGGQSRPLRRFKATIEEKDRRAERLGADDVAARGDVSARGRGRSRALQEPGPRNR